jgi:hypothetical protein
VKRGTEAKFIFEKEKLWFDWLPSSTLPVSFMLVFKEPATGEFTFTADMEEVFVKEAFELKLDADVMLVVPEELLQKVGSVVMVVEPLP